MAEEAATRISYIGHSTLLVEMNGARLLTDPILRNRVAFLRRHSPALPSTWAEECDVVLLSHAHGDHLDLPSLRQIDRATRIIAPTGMKARVQRLGFNQVEEVDVGAEVRVGDLSVRVTKADHGKPSYFFQTQLACVGYIITGNHTIYFAGDTEIFPEMAELAGTLDLALLPVWGWGPTLGRGHLTPLQAAEALTLLTPRLAIPIHWGTLIPWGLDLFHPRFLVDPPYDFARFAAKIAPTVDVHILSPGECFVMARRSLASF